MPKFHQGESGAMSLASAGSSSARHRQQTGMRLVSGGIFRMGSDKYYPEEAPVHRVTIDEFRINQLRGGIETGSYDPAGPRIKNPCQVVERSSLHQQKRPDHQQRRMRTPEEQVTARELAKGGIQP
jgi:hypothetical protein